MDLALNELKWGALQLNLNTTSGKKLLILYAKQPGYQLVKKSHVEFKENYMNSLESSYHITLILMILMSEVILTHLARALPKSFTVSVFPVPAGPRGLPPRRVKRAAPRVI